MLRYCNHVFKLLRALKIEKQLMEKVGWEVMMINCASIITDLQFGKTIWKELQMKKIIEIMMQVQWMV